MINRQHDKWNFNESVLFMCYRVVLLFDLVYLCSNYCASNIKTCYFYVAGHAPQDASASNSHQHFHHLINDQTDSG